MKKTLLFIFIVFIFYSCQDDNIVSEYPFEAEVIRKNLDCSLYEIKITKGLEKVKLIIGTTSVQDIYIAKNLPNELEVNGLKIKLDLRKPENNEFGACTTLGPSYAWVFVIKAESK